MEDHLFYKLYSNPHYVSDTVLFRNYTNYQIQTTEHDIPKQSLFIGHELPSSNQNYLIREVANNDLVFTFLIADLIILLIMLSVYRKQLTHSVLALFSKRHYQEIEGKSILKHPVSIILFLVYILNFSLLIKVLIENNYLSTELQDMHFVFPKILFTLLIYYSLKTLFIFISAQIFNVSNFGRIYTDYIFIWTINMGVFLSFFLWFETYLNNWLLMPLFLSVWLLLSSLRIAQTLFRIIPKSEYNSFHFFIYLCTVEILPLAVLGKLVMMGIE